MAAIGRETGTGGFVARFLAVGTFWKILLANALIVAAALMIAPDALHVLHPSLSTVVVIVLVIAVTLLANALVLRLALAPLTELERTAERVASGDLTARARLSPLADRPLTGLTHTFNRMVHSVEAQRRQARDVAARALTDVEESRHRLSRDLRDEAAQTIASAMIGLRAIRAMDDPATRAAAVDEVRDALAGVAEQLRDYAGQLRPSGLDLLGADQVIESYASAAARGAGLRLTVERESLRGALQPGAELELLRLSQDLVDSAVNQADSSVRLRIDRDPAAIAVAIERDGALPSFPDGPDSRLFALRERASYFGGTIDVRDHGRGATVRVSFPLDGSADAEQADSRPAGR